MQKRSVIALYILLSTLVLGMGLVASVESGTPSTLPEKTQPALEARLLDGQTWQTLSRDNKIAYIWGIGNFVELERTNLASQQPQPPTDDRKSFLPYFAYGLSGMSIEQVVNRVDSYYQTKAEQRNQPVLNAIFQAIVMPRLKEARAGTQNR
jgi:hypothetical protein